MEPTFSGAEPDWISGMGLAADATVLIHDGQYTDEEYPGHEGWGHSSTRDGVTFAQRANVEQLILTHHDPSHDDQAIDQLGEQAREHWRQGGRDPGELRIAHEGLRISL